MGAAATGMGAGARDGITGDWATATVPARLRRPQPAAARLRTPCGGVCGENGFGAASRGSSAPQPRQNL